MSFVNKSEYDKLVNENHDLRQKLENFIPRRRVRRIYKQVEKILKQDGIIDDLEDDDVIPKQKVRDKIKELEEEGQKHLFENGWFPMTADTKIKVLKELLGE